MSTRLGNVPFFNRSSKALLTFVFSRSKQAVAWVTKLWPMVCTLNPLSCAKLHANRRICPRISVVHGAHIRSGISNSPTLSSTCFMVSWPVQKYHKALMLERASSSRKCAWSLFEIPLQVFCLPKLKKKFCLSCKLFAHYVQHPISWTSMLYLHVFFPELLMLEKKSALICTLHIKYLNVVWISFTPVTNGAFQWLNKSRGSFTNRFMIPEIQLNKLFR